jgi:hypothetical protein
VTEKLKINVKKPSQTQKLNRTIKQKLKKKKIRAASVCPLPFSF